VLKLDYASSRRAIAKSWALKPHVNVAYRRNYPTPRTSVYVHAPPADSGGRVVVVNSGRADYVGMQEALGPANEKDDESDDEYCSEKAAADIHANLHACA